MSVERRFALIGHLHTGVYLPLTGGTLTGSLTAPQYIGLGATNALPALGASNASTSLVLKYSNDPNYGLLAGVVSSGNAWIQVGRTDGTATAYDLVLQPLGGGVDISATYLKGKGHTSNWNDHAISSDNALTFGRFSLGSSNTPSAVDNANGAITYNYHSGGYCRQFGFVDSAEGLYTRMQSAGAWSDWRQIASFDSTGLMARSWGPTWTTSGWVRPFQITNSIQLGTGSGSTGIGSSGGYFYIWSASGDTAASTTTYMLYGNTSGLVCNVSNFDTYYIRVTAGYGIYLDGSTATKGFTQTVGTYGGLSVYGSKNSWAGFEFRSGYHNPLLMVSTTGNEMGWYDGTSAVWLWYHNAGYFWTSSSLYIVPRCGWATGGSSGSAHFTTGTAAASGGSDGDVYFRTGASRGLYIKQAGTWELVAS